MFLSTNANLQLWVEVKKGFIEGDRMVLFFTKRFKKDEIITIYFAPNKMRDKPRSNKYTMQSFYFDIIENDTISMGSNYMNDVTWKCKEEDKELLMNDNNATLSGFTGRAKYMI